MVHATALPLDGVELIAESTCQLDTVGLLLSLPLCITSSYAKTLTDVQCIAKWWLRTTDLYILEQYTVKYTCICVPFLTNNGYVKYIYIGLQFGGQCSRLWSEHLWLAVANYPVSVCFLSSIIILQCGGECKLLMHSTHT